MFYGGGGPRGGPVCVCAFALKHKPAPLKLKMKISRPNDWYRSVGRAKLKIGDTRISLLDSKKLSKLQREKWFAQIKIWQKEGKCDFFVSSVSAREIDKIGISKAIQKALVNSLFSLNLNLKSLILLDGGLRAPAEFTNQKTIIKGDEKEPAIALASICAKVVRDRHMAEQAKKFPEYGFECHVGYGTKAHYEAVRKNGLSSIHRRSFCKNLKSR